MTRVRVRAISGEKTAFAIPTNHHRRARRRRRRHPRDRARRAEPQLGMVQRGEGADTTQSIRW